MEILRIWWVLQHKNHFIKLKGADICFKVRLLYQNNFRVYYVFFASTEAQVLN